jgi:peptidoglycan/LPS O-acetylase OafA/YrhL
VILLAALLGTASYYLIEQRFLRLKSRFTTKRVASPAVYSDQLVIYTAPQTGSPEVNWKST